MKKSLIKITVVGMLLSGSMYLIKEKDTASLPDVVLENIEALAADEELSAWFCFGSGSLDCPNGTKVEYIVDNYRLEL